MSKQSYTLRVEPKLYQALSAISSLNRRSKNQLINEAIEQYVVREGRVVEQQVEQTLQSLKLYTQKDPAFEQAIEQFARAEVDNEDPLEESQAITPLQSELRALLGDA